VAGKGLTGLRVKKNEEEWNAAVEKNGVSGSLFLDSFGGRAKRVGVKAK
jgi:hypothetical protein